MNKYIIIIFIVIVVGALIYCFYNKKSKKSVTINTTDNFEIIDNYNENDDIHNNPNIHGVNDNNLSQNLTMNRKVENEDGGYEDGGYEMIQNEIDEEAFNQGFGMGPGVYGSGRHTSEMVGN